MAVMRPGRRQGLRASGTGKAVVIDTWRGKIRVRSWPRKRGKAKSAKHKAQVEWFREANILAKYAPAFDQAWAKYASQGTGLYPRDLQLINMAGRLCAIITGEGELLVPESGRQDVSRSLDFISAVPGSLMVRGPDIWQPVAAPTVDGQALVWDASTKLWKPGSPAGGGGLIWTAIFGDSLISAQPATTGEILELQTAIRLHSLQLLSSRDTGKTGHVEVWTVTGTTLGTKLATTTTASMGGSGTAYTWFDLSSPLTIAAGSAIAILMVRDDGSATSPTLQYSASGKPVPFPLTADPKYVEYSTKTPASSDTPSFSSSSYFASFNATYEIA